jgi:hypothetical protein
MTQTLTKMSDLYDRLSKFGFPQQFVRDNVLPDWWCQEFEESSGAAVEAASYASRWLNLELSSLLDTEQPIGFTPIRQPKFKSPQGSENEKMSIPTALSHRVAEMVVHACVNGYGYLGETPIKKIRKRLIEDGEIVNLDSLLRFCWQKGIPVIHCNNFPKNTTKPDGMAVWIKERPVIIVSLNDLSPSRLLFIVAHELGHIYKNHVSSESGFIVDQSIDLDSNDMEEMEANEFAGELLLGKANMSYSFPNQYSGQGLAQYCQKIATRDCISPGLVAWNYTFKNKWKKKTIALTRTALKILEPGQNAPIKINQYLQNQINWENLSEDNQDYLRSFLKLEDM